MTATSTGGGQYLDMGDAPSIPLLGQLVQERMDHIGRPKWATAIARAAAYAAPGAQAPIVGDESYLIDEAQNQRWNGTAWANMNSKIIREVNATGSVADATPLTPIPTTGAGVTGKRLVWVSASVDLTATAACGARAYICNSGGGELVRMQARIAGAGGEYRESRSAGRAFVVTGTASFGVRILREGGSGTVTADATLQIVDLGPVL